MDKRVPAYQVRNERVQQIEKTLEKSIKQAQEESAQQDAYEMRIQELEKKLLEFEAKETQESTLKVSVSDMNEMYSNHLATIDLMFCMISFLIIIVGAVVGWIGYKNVKKMVQNKIHEDVRIATEKITKEHIEPLRGEYEAVIKRQDEQDKQIEAGKCISKGKSNSKEGNYEQAIEEYSKAIGLDPNSVISYVSRGFAKHQLKRHDTEIEDYNKALEIDPDNPSAYNNRGSVKIIFKRYESAVEDLNKSIAINPNRPNPYYHMARAYSMLGKDQTETLEFLRKSIELDDSFAKRAREELEFESIKDSLEFRKLVGLDVEKGGDDEEGPDKS